MLKLLQEFETRPDLSVRRAPRNPGLYVVEMRQQFRQRNSFRKRMIGISMLGKLDKLDIPDPVQITHLRDSGTTSARQQI